MGVLNLKLPETMHRNIREMAKAEGVSINQLIFSAIAEKVSAMKTEEYLQKRIDRANAEDLRRILSRVPAREPLKGDELRND